MYAAYAIIIGSLYKEGCWMKVPFFALDRQYQLLRPEMEKQACACLGGCSYIDGPAVKQLETALAEYLHVKHAIACGNGTDALRLALRACRVQPGDEVITTPFTFFATAEAIASVGAIPVFTDIDPVTLNIDPSLVEAAVTPRTRAILPVDIFGLPADMDAINDIAKRHHLTVVEDAAQAIGAEYKTRKAGTLGDAGCFSFYPTKNLGGCGDGGMIVTDNDEIAVLARAYKTHGSGKNGQKAAQLLGNAEEELDLNGQPQGDSLYDPYKYYNYLIGDNSRLDTLQAALLLVKLNHLDEFNRMRTQNALRYWEGLKDTPLRLPQHQPANLTPCWHQYATMAEDKPSLHARLAEAGIGIGEFYPVPLHLQKAFRSLSYQPGSLPNAERACKESICLPIFPELAQEEADYIIHTIRTHYGMA